MIKMKPVDKNHFVGYFDQPGRIEVLLTPTGSVIANCYRGIQDNEEDTPVCTFDGTLDNNTPSEWVEDKINWLEARFDVFENIPVFVKFLDKIFKFEKFTDSTENKTACALYNLAPEEYLQGKNIAISDLHIQVVTPEKAGYGDIALVDTTKPDKY